MSAPANTLDLLGFLTRKRSCDVPRSSGNGAEPPASDSPAALADAVRIAQSLKEEGKGYVWTADGTGSPVELRFKGPRNGFKGIAGVKANMWKFEDATGEWVWPKDEKGTYCTGFSLAVALQAAQERGLLTGKTMAEIGELQQEWNGSVSETRKSKGELSDEQVADIRERQLVYAMEKSGIGHEVEKDTNPKSPTHGLPKAEAGDFVQIWRGGAGHSAVFLGWVYVEGKVVGMKYRTSNQRGSTGEVSASQAGGIGDRVEYFSGAKDAKGNLLRNPGTENT